MEKQDLSVNKIHSGTKEYWQAIVAFLWLSAIIFWPDFTFASMPGLFVGRLERHSMLSRDNSFSRPIAERTFNEI